MRRPDPWIIALAAGAAIALWPSIASLYATWMAIHDYQYGIPIAAIALLWLVIAVRRLPPLSMRPTWLGVTVLASALLAWLVAYRANSLIAHQVLVPVVIWLAILAGAGWTAARHLIAPVAFLYFAIPVWDYAVPLLQRMSVAATEFMLALAGVPAVVREYFVTIPEGTFRIVEGCSGKRYFMVTLAVACLSAAVNGIHGLRAASYVAICGALALLANWVRIFVVIYAGHVTGMQHHLVSVEHVTFGNAIFVALLLLVFLLARRMSRPARGTAVVAPLFRSRPGPAYAQWIAPAFVAPVLIASVFGLVQARLMFPAGTPVLGPLPLAADRWQGPLPGAGQWMPQFTGPAEERRVAYRNQAGAAVELYVNVYGEQSQGAELIFYQNTVWAPGAWSGTWPMVVDRLATEAAPGLAAQQARSPDGETWLVAYVYVVGDWPMTREPLVQLVYGLRSIVKATPSGMIALASRCDGNCEAARALVKSFWDDMSPLVRAMLPGRLTRPIDQERQEFREQAE